MKIILLSIFVVLLGASFWHVESAEVTIPDANLELALRLALGKSTGVLTDADLASLTDFKAGNKEISELTGLEYCVNLTRLDLHGNQIDDVNPLANLTELEELHLGSNRITDISALTGLTNLGVLVVDRNRISDISPLAGLTKLWKIYIGGNQVSDLRPLANLANLWGLWIWSNRINDISPLASLTKLKWLDPGANRISDISPLANLTALQWLYIGGNEISDISSLASLTNLIALNLNDNQIVNLEPLVNNSGLGTGDTVEVRENPLSNISRSVHIPALQARGVNVLFDVGLPNASIYISPIPPQLAGRTFWVDICAGTEEFPVSNLLSISLKLRYTNTQLVYVVSPASESVVAGDLMGSDVILFSDVEEGLGHVRISVTRRLGIDGAGGYGTLARVRLAVSPSINEDTSIELTLNDVQALDANGNRIWLIPEGKIVAVRRGGVVVWPGDTDNNGIVNGMDVLPIGLYWHSTGPAREFASVAWNPQMAQPWIPLGATYTDTDGNGVVDEQDILAIVQNWQKIHEIPVAAPRVSSTFVDYSCCVSAYENLLQALKSALETEAITEMQGILEEAVSISRHQAIPEKMDLFQNYPNPFNSDTWIPFQLAADAEVKITIYNVSGLCIRTLNLGYKKAGSYVEKDVAAYWNGRNDIGEEVSSGIYLYRIQAENFAAIRKMIIVQ